MHLLGGGITVKAGRAMWRLPVDMGSSDKGHNVPTMPMAVTLVLRICLDLTFMPLHFIFRLHWGW
jgi:hypothetical protein